MIGKLVQMKRCEVSRIQRHPSNANLARRVQCDRMLPHLGLSCRFPAVHQEPANRKAKRPRCDVSVHPMVTLAAGKCSGNESQSCSAVLCFPCMQRHLEDAGHDTWAAYDLK